MAEWYFCNECEQFFDREDLITDTSWSHSNYIGYDGMYKETSCRCPICGADDNYEDAYECEICGEPTLEEVCDDCKAEISDKTFDFIEGLAKEYKCDRDIIIEQIIRWIDSN